MNPRTAALIKECKRQEESCLYTSTTFFIWLKFVRWANRIFIVIPIVLGSIATWSILQNESDKFITASCALLAGLFPAISNALGFKFSLEEIASLAADFKNLQDRFRQAAEIDAPANFEIFSRNFEGLMQKLEAARKKSATPPEWCFKRAKKKIENGHYTFEVDSKTSLGHHDQ